MRQRLCPAVWLLNSDIMLTAKACCELVVAEAFRLDSLRNQAAIGD
jgi:hypothetical protein